MEKGKMKKVICFGMSVVALLFVLNHCSNNKNNGEAKDNLASIVDTIYDIFDPEPSIEIEEEEFTETELVTNEILKNKDNLKTEEELVGFWYQLYIQDKEYLGNYNLKNARANIEYYNNLMINFVVKDSPNRGYTYQNLSLSAKNKVLSIAKYLQYAYVTSCNIEKARAEREADKKEYTKSVRRVLKNWLGTDSK